MIPYKETKMKNKIAIVAMIALMANFTFIYAQTTTNVDDLNVAKADRQKKLADLNKQIKDYQQQISTTQKQAGSLKNEILIYDKQIASTELQIEAKNTQIEDTNLQINELEKIIEEKAKNILENRKILAQLLIELNEYDGVYALKTTVGSQNLSDFLDQVQYTYSFQEKVYQIVQKIKALKAKLVAEQTDLKIQVQNLEELKQQLVITQTSLSQQRNQKDTLLSQTKGLERNFQKLLATSKQDESNLEKEIENLDAQIRAKLGNKSIKAVKGVLAWPMDGILTQGYGKTGFTALGYNSHNGIDVAAPAGTPIYAAADGQVINTDMSDASYGNWAAIKHNISTKDGKSQIITLYAHMRSFKVKPGQNVKQGDIVGYEGNTGNTTKKLYGPERGYHIHFGVYDAEGFGVAEGAYPKIYGPYKIPFGYTYNPLNFLE